MKFVDRIDEAARLKDALAREKSSLVVMYGRRRLGKSTLIKRVLSDNDVYFLADRSESQYQRTLLAKVIAQVFPDFDKLAYPDWESMFRAVNYRTDKRFTICLDEFPYLVEQSPELPSVLQKLVDEKQLKYNLVLCGSSQNMMYGLFLDSTAPLYGRADEIMRLAPIRLPYIQEALSLDAMNAIEEYSVWGGVPRYWELRENKSSLDDALWHNILSVNGTLYEEPVKLFLDDVKDYRQEYNAKHPDAPLQMDYYKMKDSSWIWTLLPTILLLVMGILLFVFMMRQANGGGKYTSFGKANIKNQANTRKATFADVAGADEEKHELEEIVDFLKNPKKYTEIGARIPKGVLLLGPPAVSYTHLTLPTTSRV